MINKLNQRQTKFVQEFLESGNATKAAIKAGYSQKTAMQIGGKLLRKVEIKKAIQAARQKTAERNEMTIDNQLEYTKEIRDRAKTATNFKAELSANDQVNKIMGAYAPTKHEVTLSFEEELEKI